MTDFEHNVIADMVAWRHQLHAAPEFGFNEQLTSSFVAQKLHEMGIDYVQGVGGTGVVASMTLGSSPRSIALRADMDALRIQERSNIPHRSHHDGVMHACGHDGHTTMLLGAAKILASAGGFDGTVRFIFQPAEEWGRGALAMIEDGLLERFPFSEIYGLHNWPGSPVGTFLTRAGALMSAEDNFEIVIHGRGGHASRPHVGREVMTAACATVMNLQSIVSRRVDPADTAVVSVTELHTDGIRNVLPGEARITGDVRHYRSDVSELIEAEMRRIVSGTAATYGCDAEVAYTREFIPLINDAAATQAAVTAARAVFGEAAVRDDCPPVTVAEDFAQFLRHVPGCFALVGNGEASMPLHNPCYDFDDDLLGLGARFYVDLVRQRLPLTGG